MEILRPGAFASSFASSHKEFQHLGELMNKYSITSKETFYEKCKDLDFKTANELLDKLLVKMAVNAKIIESNNEEHSIGVLLSLIADDFEERFKVEGLDDGVSKGLSESGKIKVFASPKYLSKIKQQLK